MKSIDITGFKFGRLTAIKKNGFDQCPSRKHIKWDCICDCGNLTNVRLNQLKSGLTKSCGCIHKEGNNKKHGLKYSKEYQTWERIKARCLNKNNPSYKNYGERGIKVCERWKNSFINFYEDMGKKPSNNHSIERINNNGNYEPLNCKWATRYEQSRNKRSNVFVTINNQTMCIADWCKVLNVTYKTFKNKFIDLQVV